MAIKKIENQRRFSYGATTAKGVVSLEFTLNIDSLDQLSAYYKILKEATEDVKKAVADVNCK